MASDHLALRMPHNWSLPLGLWRGLFFSCLICHGKSLQMSQPKSLYLQGAPLLTSCESRVGTQVGTAEVPELKCQTDFATEVVCRWDMANATNCTQEFRLHYSTNTGRKSECVIENERIPGSASPSCICIIPEPVFIGTCYTFSLQTRGNLFNNISAPLAKIVKPRPLRNLTVEKSTNAFILKWTKDYDSKHVLHTTDTLYEVSIEAQGEKRPDMKNATEAADRYEIFASSLLPRKKYTARVRYFCKSFGHSWSDWSNPCEWETDLEIEGGDEWGWLIPVVCFVVMAVISTCYISLARLKQRWWDQVPSPAKSKLAKELGKKPWLIMWKMFPGDESKTPVCATSQNLLERQLSFRDSPPHQWGVSSGQSEEVAKTVPGGRPRGQREAFLTPEVPSVEPALMICGRLADAGPEAPMEQERDHVPHEDALADLFLDILGGGDGTQDADAPEPVLDKHPPARATEQELGDLGLCGRTPRKSPEGSSESDYQTSGGAASPRAASPAPQLHPSISATQYKSIVFPRKPSSTPYQAVVTDRIHPQADGQGSGRAATPQSSSYKSFSGLLGLPPASVHQPWEPQLGLSPAAVDRAQPQRSIWPSSAAAPDVSCTAESPLSGYRPLRSVLPLGGASQDPGRLDSGSPYKPLLGVFRSIPREAPLDPVLGTLGAERKAWPWQEPLAFAFSLSVEEEEEGPGQGGVKKGTECLVPHMPVATL